MMKTILISGGTGFLGRHLGIRLRNEFQVILSGRNNKQNQMAKAITGCEVIPMDVLHMESIRDAINAHKPDIIIHAAATKFVDLAEREPMECVDVNVIGSQNMARVAIDKKVHAVIGISTDKASPPVRNTYGLSKALMERIFCSMDGKSDTRFTCVRYGNVAWSTGSVFPLWKKMGESNGKIGTTGPEMRRFFFSVDDAVGLVKTAIDSLEMVHGKVLSRKMKAAQIEDILKIWERHYGIPYERIEGRPGERNDELLVGELELPYTRELMLNGILHYLISFNEKVDNPIKSILTSENTDKLTEGEILTLISNPPREEA